MQAGISSLGMKFGYAVETTAGTQPTTFKQLHRVNSIGAVSLSTEQIDASAIEDMVSRYVAGRQDTGGTWSVTFNFTNEVEAELTELITASKAAFAAGKATWFVVWSENLSKAFYITAQVPENIPMPEVGQNSLLTVEMTLTISEYKGLLTAIEPTSGE